MTLFVAGVHAVGKTYLLQPVCEQLGYRHATASQLIREQRGQSNWTVSRQVGSVDENQLALVAAVDRLRAEGQTLVLDGHFVLRVGVNQHQVIEMDVFSKLQLKGVLLLEAPSDVVAERLAHRGDDTWTLDEIARFAEQERAHAQAVCRHLGVPLVSWTMPTLAQATQALRSMASPASKLRQYEPRQQT
ncbi:MAG: ATP-binding protein [Pseudomonadota bacterium]